MDFAYNLFTIQNKIPLHQNSLKLLQSIPQHTLTPILQTYKLKFGTNYISFDSFQSYINSLNNNFKINTIKRKSLFEKYNFLSSTKPTQITKISHLSNSQSCTIFGMLDNSQTHSRIIDISGCIDVSINKDEIEHGFFVFCEGILLNNIFQVQNITYPTVCKVTKQYENGLILIYAGFVSFDRLKIMIDRFEMFPEVIIVIADYNMQNILIDLSKLYGSIKFIYMVVCINDNNTILPYEHIINVQKNQNLYVTTNPSSLSLFGREIVIIKDTYISSMKKIVKYDSEEMFFKKIASQYSYNNVKMNEYFYENGPDLVVINERYNEVNMEVDGCRYVAFGKFEEENGIFLVYNTIDNTVDISQFTE